MKKEHDIIILVSAAQHDSVAADQLIMQYLPFIKAEVSKFLGSFVTSSHDELNIAMFAFYEAIMAYNPSKGNFLNLAALSIKHRLIDFSRKEKRHQDTISLNESIDDDNESTLQDQLADQKNQTESYHLRQATKQEIMEYTSTLSHYGLSLNDVSDNCPKQDRTIEACMAILDYAKLNPAIIDKLVATKKLPIAELTLATGVSKKTIEKHRKYLVAIILAYTNGFEIIRGHLRMMKRKEMS